MIELDEGLKDGLLVCSCRRTSVGKAIDEVRSLDKTDNKSIIMNNFVKAASISSKSTIDSNLPKFEETFSKLIRTPKFCGPRMK